MRRPIIAVDADDVLCRTAFGFAEFSNRTWGCNLTADDFDEDWAKVWDVPIEVARERAVVFHQEKVFGGFEPIPGAYTVLNGLKKHYDIVVATSRRVVVEEISRQWFGQNYGGIFRDVFFSGIFDSPNSSHENVLTRTKNDLLLEIGADYLIDDQLKHCIAAEEHGVEAILFGNYRWNQRDSLPPHVTRCVDWRAVEEYFAARR